LPDPQFSIVVPLYNRAELVGRTIESVLAQTCGDFELIVVDDGSTDGSGKVVEAYRDERIRYLWKENEERSIARNTGTALATGKYINFLDSDDYLLPNHLAEAASLIENYGDPEFFHLAYEMRDDSGGLVRTVNWFPEIANEVLVTGNHLSMNGVFLRSDVAKENSFDPSMNIHEDYELWLRIASRHRLISGKAVTSVIVAHDQRSLLTTTGNELVRNVEHFEKKVFSDDEFVKVFGPHMGTIRTNDRVHIALHYAVTKESRLQAVKYLMKGLRSSPATALRNRAFYGTIKRLLV
jgi:glycosyltransferase involved in cell wall biosynthesis